MSLVPSVAPPGGMAEKAPPLPKSWVGEAEQDEEDLYSDVAKAPPTAALPAGMPHHQRFTPFDSLLGGQTAIQIPTKVDANDEDFVTRAIKAIESIKDRADGQRAHADETARQRYPVLSPAEQAIEKMLERGDIEARSPAYQQFSREHRKGTKEGDMYRALHTWEEKKGVRCKWAKLKIEAARERHRHYVAEERLDMNTGTYMPFRKVWEHEGLDRAGYEVIGLSRLAILV